MHPAISVVLLTVLIGVGQGLFLALFTAHSYALFGLLPVQDGQRFYAVGSLMVLAFMSAGLFASFFHLGRPERAWRSAAQWRSSWLSREVLVLPVFMGAVALYALAQWLAWKPVVAILPSGRAVDATVLLGTLAWLLSFALFACTGMIYACLRFLREWHTPLTVINYLMLGGASGFTLAAAFASANAPELTGFFAGWALIITVLAWLNRVAMLARNARLGRKPMSSLQTAIGIKHPQIRQTALGFMGGSFNTEEFFHHASRRVLLSFRGFFLLAAFAVPAALLAMALSSASATTLTLAFVVQFAGVLSERWYFFAEAKHPQNLYYAGVGE